MVITIDSGTYIGPNLLISFNTSYFGLDWIGSAKMDPCPTLSRNRAFPARLVLYMNASGVSLFL